jgi:hypothetical protein
MCIQGDITWQGQTGQKGDLMAEKKKQADLMELTKPKLIEEAGRYSGITGAHGMKKEELIEAITKERKKPGEDVPESTPTRAPAKKKEKTSYDRVELKARLKELKKARLEAVAAKESVQLKRIRRRYRKIRRILRKEFPQTTAAK